jgi:hypothetical protein
MRKIGMILVTTAAIAVGAPAALARSHPNYPSNKYCPQGWVCPAPSPIGPQSRVVNGNCVELCNDYPPYFVVKSAYDTLWHIAQKYLGDGHKWVMLCSPRQPNRLRVGDPVSLC